MHSKNYSVAMSAYNHVQNTILESSTRVSSNAHHPVKRLQIDRDIESLRAKDTKIGVSNDGIVRYLNRSLQYIEYHQQGNCAEMALLVLGYMLKHHPDVHTELFYIDGFKPYQDRVLSMDHIVAVIGRDMNSDIKDPMTWGNHAYFCDAYQESSSKGVFPAKTYKDNLKGMISIEDENATRIALESGNFGEYKVDFDSEDFFIFDLESKDIVNTSIIVDVDWGKSKFCNKLKPYMIPISETHSMQLSSIYFKQFNSKENIKKLETLYVNKLGSLLDLLEKAKSDLLRQSNRLQGAEAFQKYNIINTKKTNITACWMNIKNELSRVKQKNHKNANYMTLEKQMFAKINACKTEVDSILRLNINQKTRLEHFRVQRFKLFQPAKPQSYKDFTATSNELSVGVSNILRK